MIIFLNGTSSAGKSMIAEELKKQSDRPFLYYSVDHFVNFWLDEKFIAFEDEPKAWFFQQHLKNQEKDVSSPNVIGPDTEQLHWDMIESITVLIKKGYDLIIDEVLWNQEIFKRFSISLAHTNVVYLIKIMCDLIECERREKKRKDRYIGIARSLYKQVYIEPPSYDLEVETTHASAIVCAAQILAFVEDTPHPSAFLNYLYQHISFGLLESKHFNLLHQWLNSVHVSKWWGENKAWRIEDIEAKYESYVKGYKLIDDKKKPIAALIVYCAENPIGYIQCYNAYDFEREDHALEGLPSSLASIDIYIGEPQYTQKGLGPKIINAILTQYVWPHFDACFVAPNKENIQAISAYKKAGFKIVKQLKHPEVVWMLKKKTELK